MGEMRNDTPSATAVRNKQRMVIEDVATDPRWDAFPDTRAYALENSLRAAWAEPIINREGVGVGHFLCLLPRAAQKPRTKRRR
jgi:GAF domain-containing protein